MNKKLVVAIAFVLLLLIPLNANIAYANSAPVPLFTYSPSDPYFGETVTFNAADSYDPDGTIVSYEWDFRAGYGPYDSGEVVTHSYAGWVCDDYDVKLTVVDNEGASASITITVDFLDNQYPVAYYYIYPDPNYDFHEVLVGEPVTCKASASYDPDGTIDSYEWHFGDGATGSGEVATHAYGEAGLYIVELKVTDNYGLWAWYGGRDGEMVYVHSGPGQVTGGFTCSPSTAEVGEPVTFDGWMNYGANPSWEIYYILMWFLGDGTVIDDCDWINCWDQPEDVSHTYLAAGTYTVTLEVFTVECYPEEPFIWVTHEVTIWSVETKILDLIDDVKALNLQQGIDNSLDAKLNNALDSIEALNANQRNDAINKLLAFINAVEAQREKALTTEQADDLVAKVGDIIAHI